MVIPGLDQSVVNFFGVEGLIRGVMGGFFEQYRKFSGKTKPFGKKPSGLLMYICTPSP
jgi:hypothetical protein